MTKQLRTNTGIPRPVEFAVGVAGLFALSPLLLLAGICIKLTSPGTVIFKQTRIGRGGRKFTLYKFRTMRMDVGGVQFTAADDDRMTTFGRFLRRTKLDEIPELWNVIRGDMSFVGPRPEVPLYVDLAQPLWTFVLQVRPGITDPVTLKLRNEESLLAGLFDERERYYIETLQRYKLLGYEKYVKERSPTSDLIILCKTVIAVVLPTSTPPPSMSDIAQTVARGASR